MDHGGIASSRGGTNIILSACTAAETAVANKKSVILCMHGFVLLLHMLMYLALKSDEILVFQERRAQFPLLHLNRTLLHFPLNANHLST